jgi:DNA-binding beta-propeller fold protein YncE
MKATIQFLIFLFFTSCNFQNDATDEPLWIITAPGGNEFTKIDKEGRTVIPNGRYIAPAGKSILTAPHPYGLTLSPDGNIAVTANSGTSPLSITIIRDILSQQPEVQQVPPGPATDAGVLASVFMGLAISPDNQTIYVAGGQENKIFLFDVNSGEKKGSIDCSDSSR